MNQSILSVRLNTEDKKKFENFCNKTGMNVSTAINMFIKNVIMEQKLPFEIKTYTYDDYVYNKLKEAEDEMKTSNKRYSSEEVIENIKKIIG